MYYKPSQHDPTKSQLDQAIKDRLLELEAPHSTSDINAGIKGTQVEHSSLAERLVIRKESDKILRRYLIWRDKTTEYIASSDMDILLTIKDVYIYRKLNVVGAAFKHLHVSERTAYRKINQWFEGYKDAIWFNDYTV